MIRLILSDIDDTIMPRGAGCVSERTISAFRAALDAGICVGPCSGRGLAQMLPFFRFDERCLRTAIASNGTQVRLDGRMVREAAFERSVLERVVAYANEHEGMGVLCFDGATPVLLAGTHALLERCFAPYAALLRSADGRPLPLPEGPVLKANLFADVDAEQTQDLVAQVSRELAGVDADMGQVGYLNLMPEGVNKGSAIEVLAQAVGCSLDEVVVFGDGDNDVTMMKTVANGVAVANALPAAARAARWHIGACAEDAVAAAIEALAAGEWPFSA